jgi:hypothetical protein
VTTPVAEHFPDWTDRRINSALNDLDEGKVVLASKSINSK